MGASNCSNCIMQSYRPIRRLSVHQSEAKKIQQKYASQFVLVLVCFASAFGTETASVNVSVLLLLKCVTTFRQRLPLAPFPALNPLRVNYGKIGKQWQSDFCRFLETEKGGPAGTGGKTKINQDKVATGGVYLRVQETVSVAFRKIRQVKQKKFKRNLEKQNVSN